MFLRAIGGSFGEGRANLVGAWTSRPRLILPDGTDYALGGDVTDAAELTAESRHRSGLESLFSGGQSGLVDEVTFAVRFGDGRQALLVGPRSAFTLIFQAAAKHKMDQAIAIEDPHNAEVLALVARLDPSSGGKRRVERAATKHRGGGCGVALGAIVILAALCAVLAP